MMKRKILKLFVLFLLMLPLVSCVRDNDKTNKDVEFITAEIQKKNVDIKDEKHQVLLILKNFKDKLIENVEIFENNVLVEEYEIEYFTEYSVNDNTKILISIPINEDGQVYLKITKLQYSYTEETETVNKTLNVNFEEEIEVQRYLEILDFEIIENIKENYLKIHLKNNSPYYLNKIIYEINGKEREFIIEGENNSVITREIQLLEGQNKVKFLRAIFNDDDIYDFSDRGYEFEFFFVDNYKDIEFLEFTEFKFFSELTYPGTDDPVYSRFFYLPISNPSGIKITGVNYKVNEYSFYLDDPKVIEDFENGKTFLRLEVVDDTLRLADKIEVWKIDGEYLDGELYTKDYNVVVEYSYFGPGIRIENIDYTNEIKVYDEFFEISFDLINPLHLDINYIIIDGVEYKNDDFTFTKEGEIYKMVLNVKNQQKNFFNFEVINYQYEENNYNLEVNIYNEIMLGGFISDYNITTDAEYIEDSGDVKITFDEKITGVKDIEFIIGNTPYFLKDVVIVDEFNILINNLISTIESHNGFIEVKNMNIIYEDKTIKLDNKTLEYEIKNYVWIDELSKVGEYTYLIELFLANESLDVLLLEYKVVFVDEEDISHIIEEKTTSIEEGGYIVLYTNYEPDYEPKEIRFEIFRLMVKINETKIIYQDLLYTVYK